MSGKTHNTTNINYVFTQNKAKR